MLSKFYFRKSRDSINLFAAWYLRFGTRRIPRGREFQVYEYNRWRRASNSENRQDSSAREGSPPYNLFGAVYLLLKEQRAYIISGFRLKFLWPVGEVWGIRETTYYPAYLSASRIARVIPPQDALIVVSMAVITRWGAECVFEVAMVCWVHDAAGVGGFLSLYYLGFSGVIQIVTIKHAPSHL